MFTKIDECISWIESQHRKSTKSLEHMKKLCAFYGNPEKSLTYIHVTGTNGKGSVVAYFRSVLQEAGLKVGSFTSPYIECFNERIYYNYHFIEDEKILEYTNYIISRYIELEKQDIELPGFFAIVTLICFMYFNEVKPDIIIMEVGIGGLLDCTNVIMPILTIISNISYDHMNVLGNDLASIAYNKLGIVKENVPLVTIKNEEVEQQIIETCKKKNTPLVIVNPNNIANINIKIGRTSFDYKQYMNIELQMSGLYQTENASLVIEGCQFLKSYFKITDEQIKIGLKKMFWPGRLEVVSKKPLIILDGAHNINGIERLHEFILNVKRDYSINLIVAISSNKEKAKMIENIEVDVDNIIFTKFAYKRSDEALNLYELSNHPKKQMEEDWHNILNKINISSDKNQIWIFCGSLYFVSEVRRTLK